jgi:hypothetical protein
MATKVDIGDVPRRMQTPEEKAAAASRARRRLRQRMLQV